MKLIQFCAGILLFLGCEMADKSGSTPLDLTDSTHQFSYAVGNDVGRNLTQFKDLLNLDAFFQGLKDTLINGSSQISVEDLDKIKRDFFMKKQKEETSKSKKFLEENKSKEGVITTKSGLQYIVLKEGTGPIPTKDDKVKVHYHGTLPDGKVFDSSVQRGDPITFAVTGVIPGWTEALQLMKTGSKWKLFVPSELAYGARGAGRNIGPNQALVFEVELIEIVE